MVICIDRMGEPTYITDAVYFGVRTHEYGRVYIIIGRNGQEDEVLDFSDEVRVVAVTP